MLIKQVLKPGESIPAGLIIGAGIDLQSRADPGMTEDLLRITGWYAQLLEQRGGGMRWWTLMILIRYLCKCAGTARPEASGPGMPDQAEAVLAYQRQS